MNSDRDVMLPIDYIEQVSGMKIEDMPFGCRLCAESIYGGNIIAETENFFSVPDIRSIVPGHVQVVSKKHIDDNEDYMFSAGHYPKEWIPEYEFFLEFMTLALENAYQRKTVWFEHGEKEVNPRPGSIYHPHTIGVALGIDMIDVIKSKGEKYFSVSRMEGSLEELSRIVDDGPYYFYQSSKDERYIMRVKGESTPSQLIVKYMSEFDSVKRDNVDWLEKNGVDIDNGQEYLFQNFRPADRFFDSKTRLQQHSETLASKLGIPYSIRGNGVVELNLGDYK